MIIVNHISHIFIQFHSVVKTREPKDEQLCIAMHILKNIHEMYLLDSQDN